MKRGQGGSSARVTGRWRKARRVPSDAAERGRGATFDNAPFQIRRKPSKAGALGRGGRLRALGVSARARECYGLGVVFARVALQGQARAQGCFVFVLSHVVYSAAPTTPSSPWRRVDATASEKTRTRTIENQRRAGRGGRAARQPRPTRSDRDKSQKTISRWSYTRGRRRTAARGGQPKNA